MYSSFTLVSIFISLRTLFKEKVKPTEGFKFLNYVHDNVQDNESYYEEMKTIAHSLYNNILDIYGFLEMNIPDYLSENDLMEIYWDNNDDVLQLLFILWTIKAWDISLFIMFLLFS